VRARSTCALAMQSRYAKNGLCQFKSFQLSCKGSRQCCLNWRYLCYENPKLGKRRKERKRESKIHDVALNQLRGMPQPNTAGTIEVAASRLG